jgi:hypothetical protein
MAQLDKWSRRQRKAFGLSIHPFNRDPFERSIPSLRASRAKGKRMRTLVQPPPLTHCDLCGGELLLKLVESADRVLDLDNEILVCANCGREISCLVGHDKYSAHTTRMPHTDAKSPEILNRWRMMATPKFKLGQTVFLQHTIGNRGVANGVYEVTRQLPERNSEFEYQIKSSREPHERVVRESELSLE